MQRYGKDKPKAVDTRSPIKKQLDQLWWDIREANDRLIHQQMVYEDGYGGEPLTPNQKRALNRSRKVEELLQYAEAEWTPHIQEMIEGHNDF
jgi:hypothetical protein